MSQELSKLVEPVFNMSENDFLKSRLQDIIKNRANDIIKLKKNLIRLSEVLHMRFDLKVQLDYLNELSQDKSLDFDPLDFFEQNERIKESEMLVVEQEQKLIELLEQN